ncbi:hypothetical protein Enr13x_20010 [Stieleria neptunia]|uniref:Uncharacterized protein n=1 Tax=Stieleria neptunia TaxID=2527979 RepID=A0A518HMU5_9BACT|nr:hypothetical protein [Stieleria neptunia]QDV42158.1 hypothetical protein Enr13x_20010 [Stieleria neptunia]
MQSEPLKIYWRDALIGFVFTPEAHDIPWWYGVFEPTETECEVRDLLRWFHEENKNDDPDLTLAPFPEHYFEDWTLERSDGSRTDICPPIPDFDEMTIEWR